MSFILEGVRERELCGVWRVGCCVLFIYVMCGVFRGTHLEG
jgi:hypothetical protein